MAQNPFYHTTLGPEDFAIPDRILGGRRTRRWRFENNLPNFLVPQMLNKMKHAVQTRHKINYRSGYKLRNIENGEHTFWYTSLNSPWMDKLSKTKKWLQEQEELRLQGAHIDRPNTKWVFQRHMLVDLKVILDRQPLQIELVACLIGSETNTKSCLLTITMTIFVSSDAWLYIKVRIDALILDEQKS